MAVLDRATRRLVDGLRARVKFLTVLVVVLAIALTVMTVLYINKDVETPADKTVSGDITSLNDESLSANNSLSAEQSSESGSASSENDKTSSSSADDKSSSSNKPSSSDSTAVNATAVPGDSVDSWNLKLVNGKNPLPKGYTLTTEKIKPSYARDVGMKFDAKAVSYLNAMCAAAAKDGINLLVISGFRTNAKQTSLYNNQVNKQRAKYAGQNKTEEEIKKIAAEISAYPGTSEHELGLAVDFNSVEESFENSQQFQWLKAHAAEYGFVMRYAEEKKDITGVIYEPWHYRYVGEKHAKKMNELGYCLEEYIEYLKKGNK